MNKKDRELKVFIKEFQDGLVTVGEDPPECFFELYKGHDEEEIIKEWHTLICFKNNTPESLEYHIKNWLKFVKNIVGRNMTPDLISEIEYHLDILNNIGIEANVQIPNFRNQDSWTYDYLKSKTARRFNAYIKKLNRSQSVVWTVEDIKEICPQVKGRLKKKELINILKKLKENGDILEYLEKDIYCGKPAYKTEWYLDPEFGWSKYYKLIPPEKAQGNSYQKDKKPFRVCLPKKTDKWPKIRHLWNNDIDEDKWKKENGY